MIHLLSYEDIGPSQRATYIITLRVDIFDHLLPFVRRHSECYVVGLFFKKRDYFLHLL